MNSSCVRAATTEAAAKAVPAKFLRNVVIFATFGGPRTHPVGNTLPNQGLGRKIARELS